ncbi:MAG: hypothetical protein LUQ20_02325 [Candidatus Methanoperedens sp.]|nr:hypothetical protein [Candidatus Methanoperedens sp.]
MNPGRKTVFLLIMLAVMVAGCLNASSTKPDWAHDVNWMGEKPDSIVEKELWTQITPYRIEYDIVNITAKSESDGLHLRVIGISNAAINPDVYDFTYSDGILTRTSYLLEALQPHDRNAAIAAAMQKKEVMEKGVPGVPTVRRILPDTSKKYYAAKTLLSVTWTGISVLVDPDEWKVVQVWNENAGVKS